MAIAQLPQTVAECHAVIALLMERVKLLEERVNLDPESVTHSCSDRFQGAV